MELAREAIGSVDLVDRPDEDRLVTVERTMRILEMLADQTEGLSVTAIAENLGIAKSIAFRIVNTLRIERYIYQDDETQNYRLTFRISNLGMRQQGASDVLNQCFPILRQLAAETGELVRLALIERGEPIWVQTAAGPSRRLRIDPLWHADIHFHVHAAAKGYLMTLDDAAVAEKAGPEPYAALTPNSITTCTALLANLAEARKAGFAISYEEGDLGICALGAPVVVRDGREQISRCVAVLTVAAPTSRVSREMLTAFAPPLLSACTALRQMWPVEYPQ